MSVQQDNLQDSYINNGIIEISEIITKEYASKIIKQMQYIHQIRYINSPIKLFISSDGGNVIAMLSILNFMNFVKTTRIIETHNLSTCCSACVWIFSNGTHGFRYAYENTLFMAHTARGYISYNDSEDKEININTRKLEEDIYLRILSQNTNKSASQIKKDLRRDKWFTAQEAKDYGIVDHIIKRKDLTKEKFEENLQKV